MRTADKKINTVSQGHAKREYLREVLRLVGQTGKACRTFSWYEGEAGRTTRHFNEKWKRAELVNVIGRVRNQQPNKLEMSAADLAVKVKSELLDTIARYKKTTAMAAPKKPQKTKQPG